MTMSINQPPGCAATARLDRLCDRDGAGAIGVQPSTIFPSIWTTPSVPVLRQVKGRDHLLRLRHIPGLGENASSHGPTWFGWISVLPSKPISRASRRTACEALGVAEVV